MPVFGETDREIVRALNSGVIDERIEKIVIKSMAKVASNGNVHVVPPFEMWCIRGIFFLAVIDLIMLSAGAVLMFSTGFT